MLMLCVLHSALQIKQREDAHSTSWEGMAGVELFSSTHFYIER
jgi:hypothetical protein